MKCQHRTWDCHKSILGSRSAFFLAAFSGKFEEAKANEVDLPDEFPEEVYLMLEFLYKNNYDSADVDTSKYKGLAHTPVKDLWSKLTKDLNRHIRLYAIGDRLSVLGLKAEAARKFTDTLDVLEAPTVTQIALSGYIEHIYTTTPSSDYGLRGPLCDKLEQYSSVSANPKVQEVIGRVDELAFDMVKVAIERKALVCARSEGRYLVESPLAELRQYGRR